MQLAVSLAWLALVAWLISRALQQRHVLEEVGLAAPFEASGAPAIAVIVPARNEGPRIAHCVQSLRRQRYPRERLQILVVDDESTDDTAGIVRRLAASDPRIRLVHAPPLPEGWKGKVHACAVGAQAVAPGTQWLCFFDADMFAQPLLLASALRTASARGFDLLSLTPRHELLSLAERLIIPCGLYVLGFSQDLSKVQAPDSDEAVATGQFMLARREAYDRIGGHAAVRSEICEDLELARRLKRGGFSVRLQSAGGLLSTRMYTGWRTLWPGFAKNLTAMFGGPLRTVTTALAALTIAWAAVLVPLMDAGACERGASLSCVALAPALLASAAAFALHVAGAAHFDIPLWYGLVFPLGYTAGAMMALDSVRWRLVGRVRWKGRVYQ